jgi:uncharacterized RDD family membrane protein YckC
LLAFAIDVMLFVIPYFLFAVVAFAFSGMLSRDAQGDLTEGAMLLMRVLTLVLVAAYVLAYELSSPSIRKRVLGLRVVRSSDWNPPSMFQRLVRLGAKTLTIATLGAGYITMMFDTQRRALHDRLVGTRVIQN